ncbi:MAG: cytochrome d ubiquinol oxidase subunit II [Thiohalomonadaceae bacterium]
MTMETWLPLVWYVIIGFAVFMYVLLDGFDLGVGILFPFAPSHEDRDVMMNSVAPVWDGNETWLVLGGGGLFIAFPGAYAAAFPALYLPLLLMLIALLFRGVAFEFRFRADRSRRFWSAGFFAGSLFAAFAQGLILGNFVAGIPTGDGADAGAFQWLTPFTLFTALALVIGYALLGATWLILKTDGPLQAWAYSHVRPLTVGMLAAIAIVSLWTPLMSDAIAERWFSWPNILYLSPVPLVTALLCVWLWRAESHHAEEAPFLLTLGLFLLSFVGLAISLWPNILPPDLTIWEAASAPSTQAFMLVGVVILMPLVLGYTAYSYWVFRGKVRHGVGYH